MQKTEIGRVTRHSLPECTVLIDILDTRDSRNGALTSLPRDLDRSLIHVVTPNDLARLASVRILMHLRMPRRDVIRYRRTQSAHMTKVNSSIHSL